MGEKILFIVLCLNSMLLLLGIVFVKIKIGTTNNTGRFFIDILGCMLLVGIGDIGIYITYSIYKISHIFFINIGILGITFIPVFAFMMAIVLLKKERNLNKNLILLSIIPVISNIVCWINEYRGLVITKFSFFDSQILYGKYFFIHQMYSYVLLLISLFLFAKFTIKNRGFFSKQSLLILFAFVFPSSVDLLDTFDIINADIFTQYFSVTFTIPIVLIALAIFKFNFLKVLPIAIKTVLNKLSDSFLALDENMKIIDYNQAFQDIFEKTFYIKKGIELKYLSSEDKIIENDLLNNINNFSKEKKSGEFEYHFQVDQHEYLKDTYFMIEITPIIFENNYLGIVILFKNITEHKKHIQTIKAQQENLIEQERLASLGALMGGISHNMKTPIMSISGCVLALDDLISEYSKSIGNPSVNAQDHQEIVNEMSNWMNQMKKHFTYISEAITNIKDHTVKPTMNINAAFSIKEAIQGVEFLMKYELKTNNCFLEIDVNIKGDQDIKLKGDKGTFTQIINNLISNAIQSYEKNPSLDDGKEIQKRKIEFQIIKEEEYILLSVRDYGKGIPEAIKDKLFKDMVTTKGKDGSGIGLFMSYTKVKGLFKGDIWFESQEGKGTTFFIKIPLNS